MRRQARISGGGALVVRSASALQVWLWLLIFIFQNEFRISRSIQPGYLDFDNLPETNFTCAGKVIGGYYADLETSCQMFHVCTVGQQDEPMDIKFLCLNGTVFDQETRVCERVDEVDCTKSEKFYSLNLELYGSTAPPIIQPDQPKSQDNKPQTKPKHEQENDPSVDVASTTTNDKSQGSSQDVADSTEDPVQEIKKDTPKHPASTTSSSLTHNEELTLEYQEEDEDDGEYEDYSHVPTTTQKPATTTTKYYTTTITTTTKSPPTTTIVYSSTVSRHQSPITHLISSPSPVIPSLLPSAPSPLQPSAPSALSAPSAPSVLSGPSVTSLPSLDPSLLSPQEFIYRHRGPGSEAISFQSFRPADGVYITHAPPHQFDHFQYESSRTAPRPAAPRPTTFVQRPQPAPFRTTTLDPRDQILRPGPTSQPSERQETSVKNRQQPYQSSLPAQRPLPFNPYYYDRKRSEDSEPGNESSLSARSVAPVAVTERPPIKLKSPPRVIVTASASVSDSTGKRLNYTVGNVVKAVKPIVPINYDDYKESDLIFDPFFLDVPKLQKRRKTRSNSNRRIFTIPATTAISPNLSSESPTVASSPVTSRATTTERASTMSFHNMMTTATWNPNDYVDDNYEPHAYVPPVPPLAVLVPQHLNKLQTQEKQTVYNLVEIRTHRDKSKAGRTEQPKPTSAPAAQTTSSQREGADTAPLAPAPAPAVASAVAPVPAASPSPSPPLEASACVSSRSTDCRIRA